MYNYNISSSYFILQFVYSWGKWIEAKVFLVYLENYLRDGITCMIDYHYQFKD